MDGYNIATIVVGVSCVLLLLNSWRQDKRKAPELIHLLIMFLSGAGLVKGVQTCVFSTRCDLASCDNLPSSSDDMWLMVFLAGICLISMAVLAIAGVVKPSTDSSS